MTSASSEKTGYENHVPDRNLAMELVRVTEAAAIAASLASAPAITHR